VVDANVVGQQQLLRVTRVGLAQAATYQRQGAERQQRRYQVLMRVLRKMYVVSCELQAVFPLCSAQGRAAKFLRHVF